LCHVINQQQMQSAANMVCVSSSICGCEKESC